MLKTNKEHVSVVADFIQELGIECENKEFVRELWLELNKRDLEGFEFSRIKILKSKFPKAFAKVERRGFKIPVYNDKLYLGRYFFLIKSFNSRPFTSYGYFPARFNYEKKKIEFFTRADKTNSKSPTDIEGRIYLYSLNGCKGFLRRVSSIQL